MAQTDIRTEGDLTFVATHRCAAPRAQVYAAWTDAALFRRWWVPEGMPVPLRGCELDVREGGSYRLTFGHDDAEAMAFFGDYLTVEPEALIVWSNAESEPVAVTTVTFATDGDGTLVTYAERHGTQALRDEALEGSAAALPGQFAQLDALLAQG